MANATDTRSPRSSSTGAGDSPQSRRNGKNNNLSAPWSHVVRGESESIPAGPSSSSLPSSQEPEPVIPDSDFSLVKPAPTTITAAAETICSSLESTSLIDSQMDSSDNININVPAPTKKPAWNKPSNGVVEVGSVMGAASWPALSEAAKASPKSSSDSLKALSDGSVSVTQGPVIASVPQKQVNSNANPNSTPNHAFPTRQKSMKRGTGGGGGGGPVNGGLSQPPPLPSPSPTVETHQNSSGKPGPVVMDSSPREPPHYKNNNSWEGGPRGGFISQPHSGNDHPQQHRNSFRRHNGPHPNSYGGGRHNQDRGNHEWNSHRSFNGRNVHMQQQRVPGNFQRAPPPNTPPFISPQPVPPFPSPLSFPVYYVQGPPPESLRGMPGIPAPVMYVPPPDAQLRARIIKQIDYYFSPENLCKDTFLRQNMDDQGWVCISVIAPWNRVRQLTTNVQLILDALRSSMVVEVQGDKLRKRNDWMNWPRLPQNQFVSVPVAQQSPGISNHDMLADRLKNVRLEEGKGGNLNITTSQADTPADPVVSRSSSGHLSNQWGGPEQATVTGI